MREKAKHNRPNAAHNEALELWADTEHRLLVWVGRGFFLLALVALILRPFSYDGGATDLLAGLTTDDPMLLILNLGLPIVLALVGGFILWRPARYDVRRNQVERLAEMNPALLLGIGLVQVVIGVWILVTSLAGPGLNLPNLILVVAFVGIGLLQGWRGMQVRRVRQ